MVVDGVYIQQTILQCGQSHSHRTVSQAPFYFFTTSFTFLWGETVAPLRDGRLSALPLSVAIWNSYQHFCLLDVAGQHYDRVLFKQSPDTSCLSGQPSCCSYCAVCLVNANKMTQRKELSTSFSLLALWFPIKLLDCAKVKPKSNDNYVKHANRFKTASLKEQVLHPWHSSSVSLHVQTNQRLLLTCLCARSFNLLQWFC